MESTARLMFFHISPRKVRLVADMLKGMDVRRAELVLRNTLKRSSGPLEKLLKSAVANGVSAFNADASRLYVKKITVDAGPVAKRMMPRAFGRGAQILKRTSHVSIVLGVRGEESVEKSRSTHRGTAKTVEARVAEWEEVKGEVAPIPAAPARKDKTEGSTRKKKFGGFSKKIFTRKVI